MEYDLVGLMIHHHRVVNPRKVVCALLAVVCVGALVRSGIQRHQQTEITPELLNPTSLATTQAELRAAVALLPDAAKFAEQHHKVTSGVQAMLEQPQSSSGALRTGSTFLLARRIYAEYRDVFDFAHIALPGGHGARRNRGRLFNIDLINKLEADSRAARPNRELV